MVKHVVNFILSGIQDNMAVTWNLYVTCGLWPVRYWPLQLAVLVPAMETDHKCNFWMRHQATLRKFEAIYKKLNMAFSFLVCLGYKLCRLWGTGWCNYERSFVALLREWRICFKKSNSDSFSWRSSVVFQERILPLRVRAVTFHRAIVGFDYWVSTAMQELSNMAAHLISEGSVAHVS
jgi:hypothetical protein